MKKTNDESKLSFAGKLLNLKLRTWESFTGPSQKSQSKETNKTVSKITTPRVTNTPFRTAPSSAGVSRVIKWENRPRNPESQLLEESIHRAISNGVVIESDHNELTWDSFCFLLLGYIETNRQQQHPEIRTSRSSTTKSNTLARPSKLKAPLLQQYRVTPSDNRRKRSTSDPGFSSQRVDRDDQSSGDLISVAAKPILANNRILKFESDIGNQKKIQGLEKELEKMKQRESELVTSLDRIAKEKRDLEKSLKDQIDFNTSLKELFNLHKLSQ